jgi:hypothetical protein
MLKELNPMKAASVFFKSIGSIPGEVSGKI